MALRFQDFDEIDRELKRRSRKAEGTVGIALLVMAFLTRVITWIRGESIASWEKTIAALLAGAFVWFVYTTLARFYTEFAIRAKEIDGKASAIEEAVNAARDSNAELQRRLTAIEEKLDAMLR